MLKTLFASLCLFITALSAQTPVLRINAGGPAVTDADGTTWLADKYFVGGATYVSNPALPAGASAIFKSVRNGGVPFSYKLPVANGKYKVNLKFAEVFANYPSRVFNVTANGLTIADHLNVSATAGGSFIPITVSFDTVASNLEGINLTFTPITKSAIVSGIEVLSIDPAKPKEWCPGPVLSRVDDKTFMIGANWTPENPCHIQFNVIPPANRDPISVITYTQPVLVNVNATTETDEFYVWSSGPIWNTPTTVTGNIIVGAKNPALVSCVNNGCQVQQHNNNPRMFLQNTSPMGTVALVSGVLAPKVNNIMEGNRQITVGPGAQMSLTVTDGVLFVQLDPVAAQTAMTQQRLQQSYADMEVQKNNYLANVLKSTPMPVQQVKSLEARLNSVERQYYDLKNQAALTPEDTKNLKMQFQQFQQEMMSFRQGAYRGPYENPAYHIEMQMEGIRHQMMDPTFQMNQRNQWRVPVPEDPTQPCMFPQWADDGKLYYQCNNEGKWGALRYEKLAAPKPKPPVKPVKVVPKTPPTVTTITTPTKKQVVVK